MLTEARIVSIIEKATRKLLDPDRIVTIVVNNNRLIALDGAGRLWRRFIEAAGWHRMELPREEALRAQAAERRRAYNANRRAARTKTRRKKPRQR